MDKTMLKITLATVLIATGAGAALAKGPGGMQMDFETLDADGSGEITVEDMTALRDNRFAEIDTDGDGSVSEAEYKAYAAAQAEEKAAERFARLDADGDGALSRDALEARGGRQMGERMISRFDTDNSGGVSAEEFEEAQMKMSNRRGGGKGEKRERRN